MHRSSLTELRGRIRDHDLTARTVVEHHLSRSQDFQSRLNAYTDIDEQAADRAGLIDRPPVAGGPSGRLAGVPIAVKDLIDHEGRITTCGSGFYRHRAGRSATVVDRLEEAGAVVIGRTGLHEFAFGFSSENDWFGPVRNPWDTNTSPGGSSGGSAAAVAAGLAAGAIGTDTGGSIRVPAALCGLVGLKVTHGRIPLTGVFPLASSLDTVGPIARNIDDAAVLYEAMAGHDPRDPWSAPRPVPPTGSETPLDGLVLGIPQPWVEDAPATAEVRSAFQRTLERLGDCGAVVREVRRSLLTPSRQLADLINAEAASVHREWLEDPAKPYGPEVDGRLRRALEVTGDEYVAAQAWRAGLRNAVATVFEEVDFLVTPATGATRKVIGEPSITVESGPASYRLVLSWFASLVNHMGAPALVVPLDQPGTPPPSLQVIGPWWSEDRLLGLGRSLERAGLVAFRPPPAP